MAGKSEQICTAFPLTTFSRQKYARRAFKKFSAKSLIQFLVQKFLSETSRKFKNEQCFPATCREQGYFGRQDAVWACITFYPLSKFSRCKESKSLLPFATRKLIERVDGKTHKLNLCALPSTRSTSFSVTKGRRDFYSLQRENLLSG